MLIKIQSNIFQEDNPSALINTNINEFNIRFGEINKIFEECLQGIYAYYINNKYKEDVVINYEITQQFVIFIMESDLHALQRQICIKLMNFRYLNAILIIDEFFDRITNSNIKTIGKDEIVKIRADYEQYLFKKLINQSRDRDHRSVVIPIKVMPAKDMSDLLLDFIIFSHVDFSKAKLPKEISGCVFRACIFREENINNTQFNKCNFDNCNFSWFTIHGAFKSCEFNHCNFKAASFEFLDLVNCNFKQCSMEDTDWYEVDAAGVYIEYISCRCKH